MSMTKKESLMDTVGKVRAKMAPKTSMSTGWEDLWRDGLTPWDLGQPTPLLIHELEQQMKYHNIPQETCFKSNGVRYSLVPGCGSAYDLVTIQRHQSKQFQRFSTFPIPKDSLSSSSIRHVVLGLDLSPTALEKAQTIVKQHSHDTITAMELRCGDFWDNPSYWKQVYSSSWNTQKNILYDIPESQKFDFIFDYTFFCAIHPSLRSQWGQQMAKLLHPTMGRLLTIIFPILPMADPMLGPPYPVSFEDYRMVLEPNGIYPEERGPYPSSLSVPSRTGKELICFWKFKNSISGPSML
jgi:methyl halide transferase